MTPEIDARDVERVLAGEVEAFEDIVLRWQRPLIQLAYRFCRDRAWAEELAQDALLKAFRGLAQWRGEGAFSTWLFSVATNVYRSSLRRKRLLTVPLENFGYLASRRSEQGTLERKEREELVHDAVRSLPPKYRDAVILFYFHEMDLRQAAASLGLAEGTVKSHLFRARKLLEKHLAPVLTTGRPEQEEVA